MPDLWMDVDVALAEVPVNILPLIDDTDFKTIEGAVAYNAAGMALRWHFVTPAGAYTVTSVTPTTAGVYDWTDQGDSGIYTIEIPASGGVSINNDTEGFGWFTGVATGILPWRGPTVGLRASGLNDLLVESAFSATRGLVGTALPAVAAEAAGGLFTRGTGAGQINQAANGQIDANTMAVSGDSVAADNAEAFFDGTGYAGTGNTIPTVTTVNGLAANVITAASMATDAGTEIAAAVWNEDATGHQTQGTFGQAIGDPVLDTNTLYKAAVTDATGATVGVDVVDLKTQIGVAGAGLTAIDLPNQTMDITGNITGNLSGSVGSVTGAVGSVTGAVGSVTGAVGSVTGAVGSVTGNVGGSVASVATGGIAAVSFAAGAIDAAAIAANAIGASEVNADVIDEIWDELIGDSTVTARQAMKAFMASLAGKLSGAATTTVLIRNVADDVNRITATVDADGNRSAVTLSL